MVKSHLPSTLLSSPNHLECISVLISPKLVISSIYVPPSANLPHLYPVVSFINDLSSDCTHILVGDFNMPDINWQSLTAASPQSELVCDTIYDKNLHQLIAVPTHVKGNILDLVLTNSPEFIINIKVHSRSYSSDHYLISVSYCSSAHSTAKCNSYQCCKFRLQES